jgi:glutathione peroxidase
MAGAAGGAAGAAGSAEPGRTAWDFTFDSIDEGTLNLADFRGRVLLVTNTASFCGYTYQYEQLEKLHRTLDGRGLTVIGVPSQDFNQESASNAAVKQFCEATFGVAFPMAGISHVRGPEAHPFYAWVRAQQAGWEPHWNFNKVLIGRDGLIRGTYGSADQPGGPKLQAAIGSQLGT